MSKHMRQLLRETPAFRRVVGFGDAVADLGTHRICGTETLYSKQMVYNILYNRSASKKLLKRIVERRPDLLDLSFVAEETKDAARRIGWRPGMKPAHTGGDARASGRPGPTYPDGEAQDGEEGNGEPETGNGKEAEL